MNIVAEGLPGNGKTFFLSRLVRDYWKKENFIYSNSKFYFDQENKNIKLWNNLNEIAYVKNGVVFIDEGQKYFHSQDWANLPAWFRDLITSHRHKKLIIITSTQEFAQLDVTFRRNVLLRYKCESLLRFPKDDRYLPTLQILKVKEYKRKINTNAEMITFEATGKNKSFIISKYWTPFYYDSYEKINLSEYLCKIEMKKKTSRGAYNWIAKIKARELIKKKS